MLRVSVPVAQLAGTMLRTALESGAAVHSAFTQD
jgi:hypothetical protein